MRRVTALLFLSIALSAFGEGYQAENKCVRPEVVGAPIASAKNSMLDVAHRRASSYVVMLKSKPNSFLAKVGVPVCGCLIATGYPNRPLLCGDLVETGKIPARTLEFRAGERTQCGGMGDLAELESIKTTYKLFANSEWPVSLQRYYQVVRCN